MPQAADDAQHVCLGGGCMGSHLSSNIGSQQLHRRSQLLPAQPSRHAVGRAASGKRDVGRRPSKRELQLISLCRATPCVTDAATDPQRRGGMGQE
eukprot:355645-Chlamydomonas_euryale.AAC.36